MTDFFISYTSAQGKWAEWIGFVLEEEGFTIKIQAWDFRPGSNFVLEMQAASEQSERTIMVLSPEYVESQFAAPEWGAAFSKDPEGWKRTLVPIVVEPCQPKGLLSSIVHINLVGMDEESARSCLIEGMKAERAKPSNRPAFPGSSTKSSKDFPGPNSAASPKAIASMKPYMPNMKKNPTDIEKRRFIKDTFDVIRTFFEQALKKLSEHEPLVEYEFNLHTSTEFRAEIFINGKSKSQCRIWQGAMHSENSIGYASGRISEGSCNEIIGLSDNREGLYLTAMMASGYNDFERSLDMKKLTQEDVASYLWHSFVRVLEY